MTLVCGVAISMVNFLNCIDIVPLVSIDIATLEQVPQYLWSKYRHCDYRVRDFFYPTTFYRRHFLSKTHSILQLSIQDTFHPYNFLSKTLSIYTTFYPRHFLSIQLSIQDTFYPYNFLSKTLSIHTTFYP